MEIWRMKNFLLLASVSVTVTLFACASAPRPAAVSPECAAASDSLSKYVSVDALPFAHLIGTPRVLPVPPSLRRGDSIAVEFVVRPDGLADPSTVEIIGSNDQGFARPTPGAQGTLERQGAAGCCRRQTR